VVGIGKQLREYDAVSTSLFAMSPTLLEALDALDQPSLTEGVAEAARRRAGRRARRGRGGLARRRLGRDALHAEWLLRVYGDELDPAGHARGAALARPPTPWRSSSSC
jgi:hypothetical protein